MTVRVDADLWLVTSSEAALTAGRRPSTIRAWAHRRLIEPVGYVGKTPYYDLADVMRVERDTRHPHERLQMIITDATITEAAEVCPEPTPCTPELW